ncbi:MAG: LytTR family DNA-binding domain-containing protein [Bacteroidota bacterium]|nr:LytTR family DNA-binding domain-containing protein [Bacteroidota bacterium]MDX5431855.1 LytTR family DNA-binding domain-containing protein [Bacteroidota bacterium]MDX5470566.1 LytTR family DNA-binding domain-containing protein [Bacteroidota bacterium]
MLRIVICDDEEKARRLLKHLLEQSQTEIEVVAEVSNLPDAVIAVNEKKPDILFLDIEMPQFNGLQIAEFYPEKEIPCELVFVTAYNEFAMQALRLSALDYILKPATLDAIDEVVSRYVKNSSEKKKRVELLRTHFEKPFNRIALPNSSGFQFVEMGDILYLEADGMYTHIYMSQGNPILVSKPLVDFERLLQDNKNFFKAHRKYIVNLNHMNSFTRSTSEIEMEGGALIPLSRHRKQEFEDEIHSLIPGRAERG